MNSNCKGCGFPTPCSPTGCSDYYSMMWKKSETRLKETKRLLMFAESFCTDDECGWCRACARKYKRERDVMLKVLRTANRYNKKHSDFSPCEEIDYYNDVISIISRYE